MTTARLIRFTLHATFVLTLLDLAAGFVWLGMGTATAPQDARSIKGAIELHDAAQNGNASALRRTVKALRQLRRKDPWEAEAGAYLGSAYAIAVRDGWFGPSSLIHVARAIHHLNAALDLAPDSVEGRMVRLSVQNNLPRIFGHWEAAVEDAIALDQIFRRIEEPRPAIASSMLPIYDFLTEVASDRGNWADGQKKANDALKDDS